MVTIYDVLQHDSGNWVGYGAWLFLPHLLLVLGLSEVPPVKQFGGTPTILAILWAITLPLSAAYVFAVNQVVRCARTWRRESN
jgi:hypothetical protein